jgi:hypothetical protein
VEKANANKAEKKASLEKLFANIKIDDAKAFRDEIKKKRSERRKYLSRIRLKKVSYFDTKHLLKKII